MSHPHNLVTTDIFLMEVTSNFRYAYVIDLCCYVVESKSEATFMILLYHIFFISLVWSFYKTIFTPVSIVPAQFEISPQGFDHLQFLGANLPIMTCLNDTVRTCRQCQIIKPDRAHHCSACNRCILKMGKPKFI